MWNLITEIKVLYVIYKMLKLHKYTDSKEIHGMVLTEWKILRKRVYVFMNICKCLKNIRTTD